RSNSTPGFKLTFQVIEGDHASRRVWHDLWLTPAARPHTLRELTKLGMPIHDRAELERRLERPLPPGIRCKVKLSVRRDDSGAEFNKVRSFDVIGMDSVEDDA